MAASLTLTEAQAELVSSLAQEDIPAKLRCAICSKLAVNAFRLPCCEQAICDNCHSTLPASCPVCEHSPLSGGDCKPHKALRTTIKVFLRTEEKKRESNRPKDATPVTPAEPGPVSAGPPVVLETRGPAPPADGTAPAEEQQPTAEPVSEAAPTVADGQVSKETAGQEETEGMGKTADQSVRNRMALAVSMSGLLTAVIGTASPRWSRRRRGSGCRN
ncbi:hypothetical protein BT67DRAFT_370275 [Trichocladium antarcticum]|uniref:RING-type domain-containing protein n=1 Tax=Trichocladium antarcticum TaxID=1450529 RepID=A0AAN6US83_9PEZI|nr:hypothetical protein BT67DRAFT_370275 [Trichocladium antarcticum]